MTAPDHLPEEAVKAALARWSNVPERSPEADVRGMLEAALPSILAANAQPQLSDEDRERLFEIEIALNALRRPEDAAFLRRLASQESGQEIFDAHRREAGLLPSPLNDHPPALQDHYRKLASQGGEEGR